MCGTKRLNPFFRLHEASEVLNKYVMGLWSGNFTATFFRNRTFRSGQFGHGTFRSGDISFTTFLYI